jgi:hypothetical protein
MRAHVLKAFAGSLDQARSLVADVPCERFAELPHPGAKHPGWILGHLCVGSGFAAAILGTDPADFATVCGVPEKMLSGTGPGSTPGTERDAYATKDELLAELGRLHALAATRLEAIDEDRLAAPLPMEEYRDFWPTIGDAAFYLMGTHEPYHLGQLSVWRRAAGLDAAGS